MQNESFEFIESNLSGDKASDLVFLFNQIIHLQKYNKADKIINIFLEYIHQLLDEEGINTLSKIINENIQMKRDLYDIALFQIKKNEYYLAQLLLVILINSENINEKTPSYSFSDLFQSLLYIYQYYQQNENFFVLVEPVSSFYYHLGLILFELKDYDKAIELLDGALKYNPLLTDALYLQSEAYYFKGEYELAYQKTIKALEYCYTKTALARGYFQLAKHFVFSQNIELSLALIMFVQHYNDTIICDDLLKEIDKMPHQDRILCQGQLKVLFNTHNIQIGPSAIVIKALNFFIQDAIEKNKINLALYFLNIGYQLTDDEYYFNQIKELSNKA